MRTCLLVTASFLPGHVHMSARASAVLSCARAVLQVHAPMLARSFARSLAPARSPPPPSSRHACSQQPAKMGWSHTRDLRAPTLRLQRTGLWGGVFRVRRGSFGECLL